MPNKIPEQNKMIKNFGYKAKDVYIEKYYKFPSFLISNPNYSSMSDSAKITYMLFKNEFRRALHEKWIDDDGMLYLEFTQKRLMQILNCYQGKVAKIISELSDNGLIETVKGEFNAKTGKNEKNKYYLLQPNISADDLFIQNDPSEQIGRLDDDSFDAIEAFDETGNAKIAYRHEKDKSADKHGNAKIAHRENNAETLGNYGNAEIAQDYYITNFLDTNRHIIDSGKDESQERLLLENFVELHSNSQRVNATFIPDKVLGLIKTFSPNYTVAQTTVKTIHNAKYKAEQVSGIKIAYEELDNYIANPDQGLYNTVLRAYQKQKTEEVKDMQNVIFTYVKNWFVEYPIQAKKTAIENSDLPKVSLHNYLE